MKRRQHLLVYAAIVCLSILSMAASCGHNPPRHAATLNMRATVAALRALQETEIQLNTMGVIPPEAHKAFKEKMMHVWDVTDSAVGVIEAWRPGEPVPAQLTELTQAIRRLLQETLVMTRPEITPKVLAVYDALTAILSTVGGLV